MYRGCAHPGRPEGQLQHAGKAPDRGIPRRGNHMRANEPDTVFRESLSVRTLEGFINKVLGGGGLWRVTRTRIRDL